MYFKAGRNASLQKSMALRTLEFTAERETSRAMRLRLVQYKRKKEKNSRLRRFGVLSRKTCRKFPARVVTFYGYNAYPSVSNERCRISQIGTFFAKRTSDPSVISKAVFDYLFGDKNSNQDVLEFQGLLITIFRVLLFKFAES